MHMNANSHDGLTRSTSDLSYTCTPGEESCSDKTPRLIRYDGYKNMHEPVSDIIPCIGPRGLLMNESDEDAVWAYTGTARGKHLIYPYLFQNTVAHIRRCRRPSTWFLRSFRIGWRRLF